jgi:hypothetical protein
LVYAGIFHLVSGPRPVWAFIVIFLLPDGFASDFPSLCNPTLLFFGERSASLTFVAFGPLFSSMRGYRFRRFHYFQVATFTFHSP